MRNDADFNSDGAINGADFLIWQRGHGLVDPPDHASGDANGDGVVNAADLASWSEQFGATGTRGAAIPKPASLAIAAALVLGCAVKRLLAGEPNARRSR